MGFSFDFKKASEDECMRSRGAGREVCGCSYGQKKAKQQFSNAVLRTQTMRARIRLRRFLWVSVGLCMSLCAGDSHDHQTEHTRNCSATMHSSRITSIKTM